MAAPVSDRRSESCWHSAPSKLCTTRQSTQTSMQLRHQAVRSHQCVVRCGLQCSGCIESYTCHQVISYSIGEMSPSWRCSSASISVAASAFSLRQASRDGRVRVAGHHRRPHRADPGADITGPHERHDTAAEIGGGRN